MTTKAPVLFVGHGNPMNAIGDNPSRKAWREMGKHLGKPKYIIAVSSHWVTKEVCVRKADNNPQINDMYGFPAALYEVKYSPKSDIELATKVQKALGAKVDNTWGIDHGIWSVLSNMYPEADVPVVMVSVDADADPESQFLVGQKLAALREEGAMIFCSGNVVHNLRLVNWRMRGGEKWADNFDILVKKIIAEKQFEKILNYPLLKDFQKSIPTTEHFYPLLTALGAAGTDCKVSVWNEYRELGSMSMTSYLFEEI